MPPALLTLYIEMVIVSRFAFKYHKPLFGVIPRWDRLLRSHRDTDLDDGCASDFHETA